jgi:hypothetical protein
MLDVQLFSESETYGFFPLSDAVEVFHAQSILDGPNHLFSLSFSPIIHNHLLSVKDR